MDLFTVLLSIIIIMLAVQFKLHWVAFSAAILMVITSNKVSSWLIILGATVIIYLTSSEQQTYWPLLMIGIVILSLVFGLADKPKEEEYPPDMGSLFGPGGLGI